MENQFSGHCKSENHLKFLQESFKNGHGIWRNLCNPTPTALEVVQQYQHAKKEGYLFKEDDANYNNRWLCFENDAYIDQFFKTFNFMNAVFGVQIAHCYANWKRDGHHYGRHKDTQDVLLVQMWNETAYTIESMGVHTSYTLSPGDCLYIRAHAYHTPVILGERATMSFSWI